MDLPESVQEIADVIGRDKALMLIGNLPQCGKRSWRVSLYVPKRLKADHNLVRILGWHDAMKMVREFGGIIMQPSNCNHIFRAYRNDTIMRMLTAGREVKDIAKAVGISERQVRHIRATEKAPADLVAANSNAAPGTQGKHATATQ